VVVRNKQQEGKMAEEEKEDVSYRYGTAEKIEVLEYRIRVKELQILDLTESLQKEQMVTEKMRQRLLTMEAERVTHQQERELKGHEYWIKHLDDHTAATAKYHQTMIEMQTEHHINLESLVEKLLKVFIAAGATIEITRRK
jgi:predicted polyphosphate/ATP-dependent NAD kinase